MAREAGPEKPDGFPIGRSSQFTKVTTASASFFSKLRRSNHDKSGVPEDSREKALQVVCAMEVDYASRRGHKTCSHDGQERMSHLGRGPRFRMKPARLKIKLTASRTRAALRDAPPAPYRLRMTTLSSGKSTTTPADFI